MAFQSVPNAAEAIISFDHTSVTVSISLYAVRVGGYTATELAQLANAVDLWVGTELRPVLCVQTNYLQTEVRGLEFLNDSTVIDTTSSGVGGISGNNLPNNCAFVVKRLSGLTGRSARGRVYLPGIPSTRLQSNENLVDPTWANGVRAAFNAINGYYAGLGWQDCIVSRYTNGLTRPTGVTFAVTQWTYTDVRVDSRRDRLP